jgi:hypothetical protein
LTQKYRKTTYAKQLMIFSKQASVGMDLDLTIGVFHTDRTDAEIRYCIVVNLESQDWRLFLLASSRLSAGCCRRFAIEDLDRVVNRRQQQQRINFGFSYEEQARIPQIPKLWLLFSNLLGMAQEAVSRPYQPYQGRQLLLRTRSNLCNASCS